MASHRNPLPVVAFVLALLGLGAAVSACDASGVASSSAVTTITLGSAGGAGSHGQSPAPGRGSATQAGKVVPPDGPDIIRTGSMALSIRRGHLLAAFDDVTNAAASDGGFVADSSTASQDSQAPTANLVVRVPAARFTQLVLAVSALGKVESEQVQGQDVTGQLVNLSARITNLQAEQRALRTLVQAAGSVPNILMVQNELFAVESQIEQLSAQQASLDNQTAYATLTVYLEAPPVPASPKRRAESTLTRGVKLAWHNLAVAGRAIVLGAGWAFPLLIAAAIGLVVWRWRRRRGLATPSPASS